MRWRPSWPGTGASWPALESVESEPPALPLLRELTEALPAGSWLQAFNMDRQGVELTGQADAASTSSRCSKPRAARARRVTSPVTKLQGKEQFRIRAGWETPGLPPAPGR